MRTKNPIVVAKKTRTDRSLLLMMPMIPVKKADTPEIPASSIGIVSARLLKNVSPPRCPDATRSRNTKKKKSRLAVNPIDHLPIVVLGLRLILMLPLGSSTWPVSFLQLQLNCAEQVAL